MGTEPESGKRGLPGGPAPRRAPSTSDYAGMGVQFGGSIVLFAYAGYWLDRRLGTSPWLLLLLVFAGAGAAFYSMYRRLFGTGGRPAAPPE